MAYGSLSTLDTLAANATSQTVIQFGEDRVWDAIDASFRVHNELLREAMASLVEVSTDRLRRYGGLDTMVMEDLDQWGSPDAQKITAGVNIGFPLRLQGGALQWTKHYLSRANVQEVAKQALAMMVADRLAVMKWLKRAIFFTANYTFVDKLADGLSLDVKRLLNADSAAIPIGPNGETFTASSHTHYIARVSTLAASDVSAVIDTVTEHFDSGDAYLYINAASEAAIRGFTSNFTPHRDSRLVYADTVTHTTTSVNLMKVGNRSIGIFDEAEVWVKPWIPANYMFCYVDGQAKPLVMREHSQGSGDFGLVADDEVHPLRAKSYQREYGFGVWNRVNGAVLYTGGTSYTNPSI